MLKINLGDEQGKPWKSPAQKPAEPEETAPEKPSGKPKKPKPPAAVKAPAAPGEGKRNLIMPIAVVLVLTALLIFVWTQWDGIMGLFVAETPPPAPPPISQPPPAPMAEPEPVTVEPDPVFVIINDISAALPPRVWLSQFVVTYDGGFEINGMAFEYDAAVAFGAVLDSLGTITDTVIPERSASSETVYPFRFAGSIDHFQAPDILDIIPADMLIAECGAVRDNSGGYGVEFTRFPTAGAMYGDVDLPFELVGSYTGLKQVIAALCPEDGSNRVYRLVVRSDAPGRVFDRVRAAFAIRRASSI